MVKQYNNFKHLEAQGKYSIWKTIEELESIIDGSGYLGSVATKALLPATVAAARTLWTLAIDPIIGNTAFVQSDDAPNAGKLSSYVVKNIVAGAITWQYQYSMDIPLTPPLPVITTVVINKDTIYASYIGANPQAFGLTIESDIPKWYPLTITNATTDYITVSNDLNSFVGVRILNTVTNTYSQPFMLVSGGGGGGSGEPTNITSSTLNVGGSGYDRSVNVKPQNANSAVSQAAGLFDVKVDNATILKNPTTGEIYSIPVAAPRFLGNAPTVSALPLTVTGIISYWGLDFTPRVNDSAFVESDAGHENRPSQYVIDSIVGNNVLWEFQYSIPTSSDVYELLANKAINWSVVNDTLYPTVKAVDDQLKTIHGIVAGGTPGQALIKNTAADYDVVWGDVASQGIQTLTSDESITVTGSATAKNIAAKISTKEDNELTLITGSVDPNEDGLFVTGSGPVPPVPTNVIKLVAIDAANYRLANKWDGEIQYSVSSGVAQPLQIKEEVTLPLIIGDVVTIWESMEGTFKVWSDNREIPLIRQAQPSGATVDVITLPPLDVFCNVLVSNQSMIAGTNFFAGFNMNGCIRSFAAGSFDTYYVTDEQGYFFTNFNRGGALTQLPANSFNLSNLFTNDINIGIYFMAGFNQDGALTSLPAGSFAMDGCITVGNYFMSDFNHGGALVSLPDGSFGTDDITVTGNGFFMNFNNTGALLSLPDGSFKLNAMVTANDDFFTGFNQDGALTSLPVDSFNTDNITEVVGSFFLNFNQGGGIAKNFDGVAIKNVSSAPINAYYSNVDEVTETVPVGGYMRYDDAVLPPFVNSIEFVINDVGNYILSNQWMSPVTYRVNNEEKISIPVNESVIISSLDVNDHLTVFETVEGDFMNWAYFNQPIIKSGVVTNTADLISMPSMQVFCSEGEGIAGDNFFYSFNNGGCIRTLPVDSFNTNIMIEFGNNAFNNFNYNSKTLLSLPVGSFGLTNVVWVGNDFCYYFNGRGGLVSLPIGSFKTDNIVPEEITDNMFRAFNSQGALTSLPTGSFNFTAYNAVGAYFCASFNEQGALIQLPAGSFNTSNILQVSSNFFSGFNADGKLVNLPVDSFRLNLISNAASNFFASFNTRGALITLPVGSFNTSFITTAGNGFFGAFNNDGPLSSLPEGSFGLGSLTSVGTNCFRNFNYNGLIAQLPLSSFNLSALTTFGNGFFEQFNMNGSLSSLPQGSFALSAIVNQDLGLTGYMAGFNNNGKIPKNPQGVLIKNWMATDLTAYYWNGTASDTEIVGTGGNAGYDDGSAPPEPLAMEILINNTGDYILCNIWSSSLSYRINTNADISISTNQQIGLTLQAGDVIRLKEVNGGEFKSWNSSNGRPLIKSVSGLQNTVDMISIPSIDSFCVYNATDNRLEANPNFFRSFNQGGALRSLPAGSFNTSNIQFEWGNFFANFNDSGKGLLQLPVRSFDISNMSTINDSYFTSFNRNGSLTSLPAGSFNTTNHTSVGDLYFTGFNQGGALTELPEGSFDTSHIDTIRTGTGNGFFMNFNAYGGKLTQLPTGSFRTNSVRDAGVGFFASFNNQGALTSLPAGSFNTSSIVSVGRSFFSSFNYSGALTQLPTGSFSYPLLTSSNVGSAPLSDFNTNGLIPMGDEILIRNPWAVGAADISFGYYEDGEFKTMIVKPQDSMNYSDGSPQTRAEISARPVATAFTQLTNKWTTPIQYKVDSGLYNTLGAGETVTLNNFTLIIVKELVEGDFRSWGHVNKGLFSNGSDLIITKIPSMSRFTTDILGTIAGDNFFYGFNYDGDIRNVPETSFMTNNITTVGDNFLAQFNSGGSLLEVPNDSFNISKITEAKNSFCEGFNTYGSMYAVPQNLIKLNNLISVGDNFFADFWSYTSIPQGTMSDGSFNIDNIASTGNGFFKDFNREGALTQLPEGSFNTEAIMTAMDDFFAGFNRGGNITYLYSGSFKLNNLIRVRDNFFAGFNCEGGKIGRNPQGVRIRNAANYPITACYWNGTSTIDESVPAGSNSSYNDETGPAPPSEYIMVLVTQTSSYNITNQWTTPIHVSVNDGDNTTIGGSMTVMYDLNAGDNVRISPLTETTFRSWRNGQHLGLFTNATKTNIVSITYMPPMNTFTVDELGTIASSGFFAYFNFGNPALSGSEFGVIRTLPTDSFDTSSITTAQSYFFASFNAYGMMATLPDGSFKLDNITIAGQGFFDEFNYYGVLTSLPAGSFNFSTITTSTPGFFYGFNAGGALTSLPAGSFNITGITYADLAFFEGFNSGGSLTSLPAGSFNTSNISGVVSDYMFATFNASGNLTNLPVGSFQFTKITSVGRGFCTWFNKSGKINALPELSFNTLSITNIAPEGYFFANFNDEGALKQLPINSFKTNNITHPSPMFFAWFNYKGALTSLPVSSFVTTQIVDDGGYGFCDYFNGYGALTYLPPGSFNTDNIVLSPTTTSLMYSFNLEGQIGLDTAGIRINNNTDNWDAFWYHDEDRSYEHAIEPHGYGGWSDGTGQRTLMTFKCHTAGAYTITNKWNYHIYAEVNGIARIKINTSTVVNLSVNDVLTIIESSISVFRNWKTTTSPLIRHAEQEETFEIINMPPMNIFTEDRLGRVAGDYFFAYFNNYGAISILPDYSFDTLDIRTCKNYFFAYFNAEGSITGLPRGSFNINGISTYGTNFMDSFNYHGHLVKSIIGVVFKNPTANVVIAYYWNGVTSVEEPVPYDGLFSYNASTPLPPHEYPIRIIVRDSGEYNIRNKWAKLVEYCINDGAKTVIQSNSRALVSLRVNDVIDIYEYEGEAFRHWGSSSLPILTGPGNDAYLDEIPDMSYFCLDVAGTIAGDNFFKSFLHGSCIGMIGNDAEFLTQDIVTAGNNFFYDFMGFSNIDLLNDGDFQFTSLETVGDSAFQYFNYSGTLDTIPEGSFDFVSLKTVGDSFCTSFFAYTTDMTRLPVGTFQFGMLDKVGWNFCALFNENSNMAFLCEGSFKTDTITTFTYESNTGFFYGFSINAKIGKDTVDGVRIKNASPDVVVANYWDGSAYFTEEVVHNQYLEYSYGDQPETEPIALLINYPGEYVLTNQWTREIIVNSRMTSYALLDANESVTLMCIAGERVNIYSHDVHNFTYFSSNEEPLIKSLNGKNTVDLVNILPMEDFIRATSTSPVYFFYCFNNRGAIRSLPDGSFNFKNIHSVENYFCARFNECGAIRELPYGSFVHGETVGHLDYMGRDYCAGFNKNGALAFLPHNAFNLDVKPGATGMNVFEGFNEGGLLTKRHFQNSFLNPTDYPITAYYWTGHISESEIVEPTETFNYSDGSEDIEWITLTIELAGSYLFTNKWLGQVSIYYDSQEHVINPGESRTAYIEDDGATVLVKEVHEYVFRNWAEIYSPLITSTESDRFVSCKLPVMSTFTNDPEGTIAGDNFFLSFNEGGVINRFDTMIDFQYITSVGRLFFARFNANSKIEFKSGSFDTSGIENVGDGFFKGFNLGGKITELPVGSFQFTNLQTIGNEFCKQFNHDGSLLSLPKDSFALPSNITVIPNGCYDTFNAGGALKSLPDSAFNFSHVTQVGDNFCTSFNYNGAIGAVLWGRFNISSMITVGDNFFSHFNDDGSIVYVEKESFNTQTIRDIGVNFFAYFNRDGGIVGMTEGPFKFEHLYHVIPDGFFQYFNAYGELRTLPTGSFNLEGITEVNRDYFRGFNIEGKLEQLPDGSFRTEEIVSVLGGYCFGDFNYGGNITSLPVGSFTWSDLNVVTGSAFCHYFNGNGGKITALPEKSFHFANLEVIGGGEFLGSFNRDGILTTLPTGCFRFDSLTEVSGHYFLDSFNRDGALEYIPQQSFIFKNINDNIPDGFCFEFNRNGALKEIPNNSFSFGAPTQVGSFFFAGFNWYGSLESIGANTFQLETIEVVGDSFFENFNSGGTSLEQLPTASFRLGESLIVNDNFMTNFNRDGALFELPDNSFNTENIISVGDNFMAYFNCQGNLKSLPTSSLRFTSLESIGNRFMDSFNKYSSSLTKLPNGSLMFLSTTSVGDSFATSFNEQGGITSMPGLSLQFASNVTIGKDFLLYFNMSGAITKLVDGVSVRNVSLQPVYMDYRNYGTDLVHPGEYFHFLPNNYVPPTKDDDVKEKTVKTTAKKTTTKKITKKATKKNTKKTVKKTSKKKTNKKDNKE